MRIVQGIAKLQLNGKRRFCCTQFEKIYAQKQGSLSGDWHSNGLSYFKNNFFVKI
ncbi:MAG TPA: hypothetical protein PKD70_04085 [Saprospiraceae bacterium]|nr:hypothetical protein [Saprospiraceae bacterium]